MKKPQWILVGITAAFLCLLIGIFVGRNLTGAYIPLDKATADNSSNATTQSQQYDGKIDINTATKEQLQLLPGVGETTAQKILDYRNENGSFQTIEDLLNVSGIGEKKLEQMKPYIKVTGE